MSSSSNDIAQGPIVAAHFRRGTRRCQVEPEDHVPFARREASPNSEVVGGVQAERGGHLDDGLPGGLGDRDRPFTLLTRPRLRLTGNEHLVEAWRRPYSLDAAECLRQG